MWGIRGNRLGARILWPMRPYGASLRKGVRGPQIAVALVVCNYQDDIGFLSGE